MASPARATIAAEFQRLGLSSPEVKAYLALLEEGHVSGYQLSKKAGIGPAKIYGVLKRLAERGFVLAADTRPVKYFARPAEEVLDRLKEDFDSSLGSLRLALERLGGQAQGNDLLAWNMTGRADVMRRAGEMIGQAERSIFLAVWPKEIRPLRPALDLVVSRGVKVHLVAYGATRFRGGTVYAHRPSDYPFRERGERRFILAVDDARAVIANFGPGGEGSGLWTENAGLVLLFRDFVIHEIYIIRIEETFPEQIKAAFGPNWERVRLGRPDQARQDEARS
jgi:sugar-specific transcriptional regulator TrmB